MPKRDRAAYMRRYRANERGVTDSPPPRELHDWPWAEGRIRDLEEEVARLKRELAARTTGPSFNSRGFHPAPKPGRH